MVSTSRTSSSRAPMAAGTRPPRVIAMMPRQGPRSRSRQASARACRCSSSQVTGKCLSGVLGSLMGSGARVPRSAYEDLDLVPLSRGAGRLRQIDALGRQSHAGERAHNALGVALGVAGIERGLACIAAGPRYRHHVEGGTGTPIKRTAHGAVERLLVSDIRFIEVDHHQWLTSRDRRRGRGHLRLRRAGEGTVAAVELAVLDRKRERREVAPLVADVVALPRGVLVEVAE